MRKYFYIFLILSLVVLGSIQLVRYVDGSTVTVSATVSTSLTCNTATSSTSFGALTTASVFTSIPNVTSTLSCHEYSCGPSNWWNPHQSWTVPMVFKWPDSLAGFIHGIEFSFQIAYTGKKRHKNKIIPGIKTRPTPIIALIEGIIPAVTAFLKISLLASL